MHVMNSQAIYEACRSATLIKSFNRYGLCTSYDELQRHHNDMGRFIVESSDDEVPFPSRLGQVSVYYCGIMRYVQITHYYS